MNKEAKVKPPVSLKLLFVPNPSTHQLYEFFFYSEPVSLRLVETKYKQLVINIMAAVVNCKNTVKRNIIKGQSSCNEIIPVILRAVNSSKKWQTYFLLKVFQGFPRLVSCATK